MRIVRGFCAFFCAIFGINVRDSLQVALTFRCSQTYAGLAELIKSSPLFWNKNSCIRPTVECIQVNCRGGD